MKYKIVVASVDSIIIYFEEAISQKTLQKIQNIVKKIENEKNQAIIDIVPSYQTILISYDICVYTFKEFSDYIELFIKDIDNKTTKIDAKTIEIPTYYGKEVGFDLEKISSMKKLSIDEIISIHSQTLYQVYTIGFAPGFAYLANLDKRLNLPRISSPRLRVPKGSVAIAENQTSIYPSDSPGGWNIIGKTYVETFNKNDLTLFSVGDYVKFKPITKAKFISNGGKI